MFDEFVELIVILYCMFGLIVVMVMYDFDMMVVLLMCVVVLVDCKVLVVVFVEEVVNVDYLFIYEYFLGLCGCCVL